MLRIVKSLLTIVAVAAIATGATGAYFTDQATITQNSFTSGVLDLSVSPSTAAVSVTAAEPGIWYPSAKITAMNNSTILNPIKWKVTDGFITDGGSHMYGQIEVSVWAQGLGYDQNPKTAPDGTIINAQNVWNGDLQALDHQFNNMPKGWSASVWFFTRLKSTASNSLQGQTSNFNLVFDATQIGNLGWTE